MDDFKKKQEISQIFGTLCAKVDVDFSAIAFQNNRDTDVAWRYAEGNRNDKYKRIVVRYGKGVAGKVISTGRPVIVEDFPNQIPGKSLDYPIMLAEHLVSVYAVPLFYQERPKGVFLVGRREKMPFNSNDQVEIEVFAKRLESLLL